MRSSTTKALLFLLGLMCLLALTDAQIANCLSVKTTSEYFNCNPQCNTCSSGQFNTGAGSGCQCVGTCRKCCSKKDTYTCNTCAVGYVKNSGATLCLDVDECLQTNPTACNGTTCENTPGSFTCGPCPAGTKGNGLIGCTPCNSTTYGVNCAQTCNCGTGICNPVDGTCNCVGTGFTGANCHIPICGDGRVVAGEQCDDGNVAGGDCCSPTCQLDLEGTPCTSDSNPCTQDICNNNGTCTHSTSSSQCVCGNYVIEPGEACDVGPNPNTACPYGFTTCQLCNSNCQFQAGQTLYCGDSILNATMGELCDDGDSENSDGCNAACQLETGYTCPTPGQACEPCVAGKFGYACLQNCTCSNGASCDHVNGACSCQAPWYGSQCTLLPQPTATVVTGNYELIVGDNSPVTFTGAFVSSLTYIGFVPVGFGCSASFLVGVSVYSNPSSPRQSVVFTAGSYSLCLSYDAAQSYVKQTDPVITVVPPAATAISITAFAPAQLVLNNVAILTVTGAVPSSRTFLAFSLDGCDSVVGVTAVPVGVGSTITMGSSIGVNDDHYQLCYSTDNQATYVLQTQIAEIPVQNAPAGTTSVESLDPSTFVVQQTPEFSVDFADSISPTADTIIAFTRSGNCETDRVVETPYPSDPQDLAEPFVLTGIYSVCYSGDDGENWILQLLATAKIDVRPPTAASTSISAISPTTIEAFSTPAITFTGAVPSVHTFVAFSPEGTGCDAVVGATALSSTTGSETQALTLPLSVTGVYDVCYSTDGGNTYVAQDTPKLTVIPPPATPTTLTSLVPDSFLTTEAPEVTFKGAVPSATTHVGIIAASSNLPCETANLDMIGLTTGSGTIVNAGLIADDYIVCYTVDDGTTWVEQTLVHFAVLPPPAAADSISAISPNTATVGDLASFTFTGVVPSKSTMIAFTLATNLVCENLQGETEVTQPGAVVIDSALTVAKSFKVCYSTNKGQTWVLQTTPAVEVDAVPLAATTTSISVITPPAIDVGEIDTFSFLGAVPSATTRFAFVPFGEPDCSTPLSETELTEAAVSISAPFTVSRSYSLCYSTDNGTTWFLQSNNGTGLLVTPPPATPNSITVNTDLSEGLTNVLVVGANASIDATGAVPSDRSIIKYTADGACEGGSEVVYTEVGAFLTSFLTSAGYHYICYSTNNRGTFVRQNLRVWVLPPPATADAITSIYPDHVVAKSPAPTNPPVITNRVSFRGLVPSNQTRVAFVPTGDDCEAANFHGDQLVQSFLETLYVNTFLLADWYDVCYSTDNGATYVKQTYGPILAIPPTPTANDLRVDSDNVTLGVAGGTITLSRGLLSESSRVGFVPDNVGACTPLTVQSVVNLTSFTLTLEALNVYSYHYLCYSTDRGASYTRQVTGFFPRLLPDSSTSVTTVVPNTVYALSPFQLTLTGILPTLNTRVRFVPKGKPCDFSGAITITYSSADLLVPAFLKTGNYSICYRLSSADPGILQTRPETVMTVLAPAATATSIQLVSPPILYIGFFEETPVIFLNSVPSSTTRGAFTKTDCSDGNRLAETAITVDAPYLSDDLDVGVYKVCYSTVPGVWFLQTTAGGTPITVEVAVAATDGNGVPNNDLAYIIGGAVGGFCLLLLVIGSIIGVYWYRKSKRLKKFEVFASMEPQTEPSFLSDNPIFESSPMYQSNSRDPFINMSP